MKLTPAQLANFERANAWRGRAAKVSRARASCNRRMVAQSLSFVDDTYQLQLPLYVLPLNDNGTKFSRGDNGDSAQHQRDIAWMCLTTQLRSIDRERITGISFARLSTSAVGLDSHDNLGSAFKYLCDAVCAWIFEGPDVWNPTVTRRIGKYDGMFTRTGGTICHTQEHSPAHGVVITLLLGEPRSPMPEPSRRSER